MTPKEALIAAKAVIPTPRQWGKGEMYDKRTGRHCAVGALLELDLPFDVQKACYRALIDATPTTGMHPQRFNDKPTTTHADVMAWFDRAIEAAS